MSIKTTHLVTRDFAIRVINKIHGSVDDEIVNKVLSVMSDDTISKILENTIHNRFYNFSIVSENDFRENLANDYPQHYINDINNLPDYNDTW